MLAKVCCDVCVFARVENSCFCVNFQMGEMNSTGIG